MRDLRVNRGAFLDGKVTPEDGAEEDGVEEEAAEEEVAEEEEAGERAAPTSSICSPRVIRAPDSSNSKSKSPALVSSGSESVWWTARWQRAPSARGRMAACVNFDQPAAKERGGEGEVQYRGVW